MMGFDANTYTQECPRLIAGASREVELHGDEKAVECHYQARHEPLSGDGMSDSIETYDFTAETPGRAAVIVYEIVPWMGGRHVEDIFFLEVDDDLNISWEEYPMPKTFELRETGDVAAEHVLRGELNGDVMTLESFFEKYNGDRNGEASCDAPVRDVAGVFASCCVEEWNSFHGTNPDVLDGSGFSFSAMLGDGSKVSASGMNSFPEGYQEFKDGIRSLLDAG